MFINRLPELTIIDTTLNRLFEQKDPLTPSILVFYGVKGIGKTSLLHKVSEQLSEQQIRYIDVKFHTDRSIFARNIILQIQKYLAVNPQQIEDANPYAASLQQTKVLLERGPLVMLCDDIDTVNESQMSPLETMLSELISYGTFCVILASQSKLLFENERRVRNKLQTCLIDSFDFQNSQSYLKQLDTTLDPVQCQTIFEWTLGHPLAMNEMVAALHEGLTTTDAEQRRQLAQRIVNRVVMLDMLANISPDEQEWYQRLLQLLSVPRRFNLLILQKLIERFAPDYALSSRLAYLVLPKKITQATHAIRWDMSRSGFTMDESVRHILLLNLQINQPELYLALHTFLAELNWQSANDGLVQDRVRYQREYLYHSACSIPKSQQKQWLMHTTSTLIRHAENHSDQLVQFLEEFLQDHELQRALDPHASLVINSIYDYLAEEMYRFYLQEENAKNRIDYLQNFYYYVANNTSLIEKADFLASRLPEILQKEGKEPLRSFYKDLETNHEFQHHMGKEFATLRAEFQHFISSEG